MMSVRTGEAELDPSVLARFDALLIAIKRSFSVPQHAFSQDRCVPLRLNGLHRDPFDWSGMQALRPLLADSRLTALARQ
jgi:hypothetical protein